MVLGWLIFVRVTSESVRLVCSRYFSWTSRSFLCVLNVPVRVSLLSERRSAESGWAATAGCWGSRSCLRLRSRWLSQSSVAMPCVPARPTRRGGEALESVTSTRRTLPLETDAGVPQSALCGRKRHYRVHFINNYYGENDLLMTIYTLKDLD